MPDQKVEVKIVEVEANKLEPGAKYIFTIHPAIVDAFFEDIQRSLSQLIGEENFVLLPLLPDELKVYAIVPEAVIAGHVPLVNVINQDKE